MGFRLYALLPLFYLFLNLSFTLTGAGYIQWMSEPKNFIGASALFAWVVCALSIRKITFIKDTPYTRLSSAAQGYVKSTGALRSIDSTLLTTPYSRKPCVWFESQKKQTFTLNGKRSVRIIEQFASPVLIRVDDSNSISGAFIIPFGMKVLGAKKWSFRKDGFIYTEQWLEPGISVSVLAELRSMSPLSAKEFVTGRMLSRGTWSRALAASIPRSVLDQSESIYERFFARLSPSSTQDYLVHKGAHPFILARSGERILEKRLNKMAGLHLIPPLLLTVLWL